jgi:non-lysosomal glucosylceramidase
MSYTPFATDVSLRFFSAIVAGEDRRTSLPMVYFDVRLANHTSKKDSVSVMFSMPNAPDHLSGTPASVREGFTSTFQKDPATGVDAVTLGVKDNTTNTPDAAKSE